jgi:hypothetical protein
MGISAYSRLVMIKYISLGTLLLLFACGEDESLCSSGFTLTHTVTAARCGQANGAIVSIASGATGAVTYRLNNGTEQSAATFSALAPGTYEVSAQDEAGCTTSGSVTVSDEPSTLEVHPVVTASACGQSSGSVVVKAIGGAAPYRYRLDSAAFSTNDQFTQLAPGAYVVGVKDADGCTTVADVRVLSEVSFAATIKEMITTNCAVTGCHVGTRVPNFATTEDIFAYATKIKERTGERSMPPPGSGRELTDEQIAQIACWADDGAPDN